jgi:hypothetical protein
MKILVITWHPAVVNIDIKVFCDVINCSLKISDDVSEEHAAFFFKLYV